MAIKTIFLDRDGVINKEVNYLYKIKDFEFINGVFDACIFFQTLNYSIIIISNQSGIGRGIYSEDEYLKINKWMLNEFSLKNVSILDTFHCPHVPNSKCSCRKPKPGMFLKAKKKYNIDMSRSWMIGDKETDIESANLAGINNTVLVRSGHKIDEINTNSKFIIDSINQYQEIISS
jgi:D-glycero-D-manno-heptose 1,7-bisphosphate phosphatase